MKTEFKEWNPSGSSLSLIYDVNIILEEYRKQGYVLTLRQLYYQLVSRDIVPNNVRSYKNIGNLVNNGRLSGLIDWEMIEDRGRVLSKNSHWSSPSEIIRAAAKSYYLNHWENQETYIEVWVEKDAVSNIIKPICSQYDVPFMANKGYSSQSAMHKAGERYANSLLKGFSNFVLIYLGDHDPSGIDMTRDIEERLIMFSDMNQIEIERIALNIDQVQKYKPPENPAKLTDTRSGNYIKAFGKSSWELDALSPSVLENLVSSTIQKYIDWDSWEELAERQEEEKKELFRIAKEFEEDQEPTHE